MDCWINWLVRSPCILINLVPRNHTALKSALSCLHKCTHRCVGTASLGAAHSPGSHFFTKCWYWPACWFSPRLIPTHTNPQAELVLARLRAQQMISWLVQNEMSEISILISACVILKNHISLSYATNTADHCVHLLKTLIPFQIRRIMLNTVTIQNEWFFFSSISSRWRLEIPFIEAAVLLLLTIPYEKCFKKNHPACTGMHPERALRIFALPVQLMIHS